MLDFSKVKAREITMGELAASLTVDDLRDLTNEMIDRQLALIANCEDFDVVFQPVDPHAEDKYATNPDEANIAWTLAHVIVHATASSEESAFLAAELARGVEREGRSRYEVSWETVTTIAQVRARLEESRRMRLASLDMWPDEPHLDTTHTYGTTRKLVMNAPTRFIFGLYHDDDHLEQIAEIARQAEVARNAA